MNQGLKANNMLVGGPMNYPTNTWQELNWNPKSGSQDFFTFCSNVTNIDAPESIRSVDNALAKYTRGESWKDLGNYANYVKQTLLPLCPSGDYNNVACFGTQNGKAIRCNIKRAADELSLVLGGQLQFWDPVIPVHK
jgi:hypothetical protein